MNIIYMPLNKKVARACYKHETRTCPVGWQITLCDPIDKWHPVVLRWISRRTIRSFTFTFNMCIDGYGDVNINDVLYILLLLVITRRCRQQRQWQWTWGIIPDTSEYDQHCYGSDSDSQTYRTWYSLCNTWYSLCDTLRIIKRASFISIFFLR